MTRNPITASPDEEVESVVHKMINNNMMANIANNKSLVDKFNDQYTTGQKIQKPSEDSK